MSIDFGTYSVKTTQDGTDEVQHVNVDTIAAGTNNIGDVDVLTMPLGGYALAANLVSGVTADITDTTATSVIAAQGEGVVIYLTNLLITNNDATVGTVVKITDGSAGATKWRGYVAEDGGGFAITFPAPLAFTANTAVVAECETTAATVQVSASGFKA